MADTATKPGWRTSEFYLTLLAMFVGAFLASGLLPDTSKPMQLAGVLAIVLTKLGYTVSRTLVKTAQAPAMPLDEKNPYTAPAETK